MSDSLASDQVPIPADFPPVVYVPCADHVDDLAEARPRMQRTKEGRLALLTYSALDRLRDGCGREHPWFWMPTEGLDQLQRSQGFDMILPDILIPPEHR